MKNYLDSLNLHARIRVDLSSLPMIFHKPSSEEGIFLKKRNPIQPGGRIGSFFSLVFGHRFLQREELRDRTNLLKNEMKVIQHFYLAGSVNSWTDAQFLL